ncbi:MAG: peptidoglycan DD-metalloendopeptidase family protein [Anaerolineales bacterium]|nr:peptidoglycan DD-metalloendopeptidase family protein [Anaerolineales bacterium]
MKRALIYLAILVILLVVAVASFLIYQRFIAAPLSARSTTPQADLQPGDKAQIEAAINKAISEQKEAALALTLYDTQIEDIQISQSGVWATAWLIPLDPKTGNVVPTEPGMALVRKEQGAWIAFLPSDPLWALVVREIPNDLIPAEEKSELSQAADLAMLAAPQAALGGYYLPYAGGETMYLTQSVGHDRYTPSGSAHFAFDFAKPGYPSGLFNVHAARGGTVKQAVWTHPNGDPNNGNYLVLEDTTTSPTTYQLYLHLAQNSIPQQLRVVGTHVSRGQFIGVADDTGVSSGNHLHFHVHTYAYSYWGTSIDITFEDVNINGGRPRIRTDLPYCRSSDICNTTQTAYTSGNYANPDRTPPQGGITYPPHAATVETNIIHLAGWAKDDDSGIDKAQFIGKYSSGGWRAIGDPFTGGDLLMAWDMCTSQTPDGPISLALEIKDKASNLAEGLPGLRHITKNYTCPTAPPACSPGANQVALFAEPDYRGACVTLDSGEYALPSSLGALGDDNAVSIQVGANVQASLFSNSNFQGRGETFLASDSSLQDNRIGNHTVSSIRVQLRGAAPATPIPTWPAPNASLPSDASISLAWQEAGGGTSYRARLLLDGSEAFVSPWSSDAFWHVNSLAPGNYTWQVKARNGSLESSWSSSRAFQVAAAAPTVPAPIAAPYEDTMENTAANWSHSNYWDQTDETNHTEGGLASWKYDTGSDQGYDTGEPNAGYLTSPPISLPASGEYFLRFWYQYETEGPERNWDQRWVQLSVDGGEFTNLLQLSDDAANYWLRSPALSLKAYAGRTVRVRFYFATLDNTFNNYRGWYIDDFSITAAPPPACADTNNNITQATPINYADSIQAVICPEGDVDYYQFQGAAGDRIGVWTEAQVNDSPLDTYLYLLDSDGHSVLAENDDQILYQRSDSALNYKLTRTGAYYIKVRSWDHATSGGDNYTYTLNLAKDSRDPAASFIFPTEGQSISNKRLMLRVSASDARSGVSHVLFMVHSADWEASDWVILGEDWNGKNGWNFAFDARKVDNLSGIAFYAFVYDWAGNSIGTGAWNLRPPTIFLPLVIK